MLSKGCIDCPFTPSLTGIQPNVLYCNCADKCEVNLAYGRAGQDPKLTLDKQQMQVGQKCFKKAQYVTFLN